MILSTAIVHLLPHANEKLSSPCLPESWREDYHPGFAFLFCLITIMLMMVLDFLADAIFGEKSGHTHIPHYFQSDSEMNHSSDEHAWPSPDSYGKKVIQDDQESALPKPVVTSDTGKELDNQHHDPVKIPIRALALSEVSVAIHSVIIGLALGTTDGSSFDALFIAITFHQLLEGLALGAVSAQTGLKFPYLLGLAVFYALTTPIGIAIGIGVQSSINQNSEAALLTQGILDAIAAGMMIYVALGDHINAIKCYGPWLKRQGWIVVALCMGAFLAGGGIMAVIGIWA